MGKFSQIDIEQALSKIIHPEINYSLFDLGMLENVVCNQDKVNLTLKLPFLQVPVKEPIIRSIKQAIVDLDGSIQVEINIEQMSEQECTDFKKMAKEGWKF
jgi:ATP-binding protein involved in chromosome partitioning